MKRKAAGKASRRAKQADDDTTCGSDESAWFNAAEHEAELHEYARSCTTKPWLQILDVFSFHEGMKRVAGTKATVSMDIRLSPQRHDLTCSRGVYLLLAMLLALVPEGLATLAPPCSLFVWLSSSVHLRNIKGYGPYGQTGNYKVRLANRIALNVVPC